MDIQTKYYLKILHEGSSYSLQPFPESGTLLQVHEDINAKRFNNGRKFFRDNLSMNVLGLSCTLVIGFSIPNLLEPLMFTKRSNSPEAILQRYLTTIRHVTLWHYDVWDPNSAARKSIKMVYNRHLNVRNQMKEHNEDTQCFTQYDMSLVQHAFIHYAILLSDKLGLECTKTDLDDYVYFWRWMGYFLGIRDENNICINGLENARAICKELAEAVVYPALSATSENSENMAQTFADGLTLLTFIPIQSAKSLMAFYLDIDDEPRDFKLTILDKCRVLFLRSVVLVFKHSALFRFVANRVTERIISVSWFRSQVLNS
ncbi:uncharacterized protein LOC133182837 [Saccostrea echinata]|uniref:uncharacterized protein LOC133182837 n=1 Tax=Saccostrea echinata TaxID=191078 RepID=UPI002A7EC5C0|nr:uncharacterized protein LOC133182837 [Saccostrea echinata]